MLAGAGERRARRELPARRLRLARGRSIPTIRTPAAIGTTGDVVGRRSDTIMILRRERNGGAALLSLPARPVGADRRHRRAGQDQLGLQRGPDAAGADDHRVARHPDQPLRRDRLRRLPGPRRRDRRRRDLHDGAGPGHALRAPPRPRLHEPRRLAGARLRPQPLLRGVDRRRLAVRDGTRRPRPHRAPAAVHPHGGRQAAVDDGERPVQARRADRGRRRRRSRSTRRSTPSRRPPRCARPPRSGSTRTACPSSSPSTATSRRSTCSRTRPSRSSTTSAVPVRRRRRRRARRRPTARATVTERRRRAPLVHCAAV